MIRLTYLDEEEAWQSTAHSRLKNDFTLQIPMELPKNIEDLWPMITEFAPQAILIDYRLNEAGKLSYTGDEVIKELRKHNKHLPMFIITSYEDDALIKCEEAQVIRSKDILTNPDMFVKLQNIITAGVNNYNRRKSLAENTIRTLQEKIVDGKELTDTECQDKFDAELYLSELDLDNCVRSDLITNQSNRTLEKLLNVAKHIVELHKR
jgi:hypothetical protein